MKEYKIQDDMSLDKCLDSGQTFRWRKTTYGSWMGVVNGELWEIRQTGANTIETNDIPLHDIKNYFNSDTNYKKINKMIENKFSDDNYLMRALEVSKGLRILKQDTWETLVSFIISQRNSIPKIKTTVANLCLSCGETRAGHKIDGSRVVYKVFPSAEQIVRCKQLGDVKLGYREEFIAKAASDVYTGRLNMRSLEQKKYREAMKVLEEIHGVGPKVANCVALFGLNKLEAFPIDIWMQRIIDEEYNGKIDRAKLESSGVAGIIQQYMFYLKRFN